MELSKILKLNGDLGVIGSNKLPGVNLRVSLAIVALKPIVEVYGEQREALIKEFNGKVPPGGEKYTFLEVDTEKETVIDREPEFMARHNALVSEDVKLPELPRITYEEVEELMGSVEPNLLVSLFGVMLFKDKVEPTKSEPTKTAAVKRVK